jgi:UDP-2,3-diacylglucosamine hydrolase
VARVPKQHRQVEPPAPSAATGRQLFIADVHLRLGEPARARRLGAWLAAQRGRCDRLVILGDLFDFWIGPKHLDLPDYREPLEALGRWTAAGVPVEMFAGNRDFYLADALTRRYGITVFDDFDIRAIGGRCVYLCHGDLLCGGDTRYRRARWIIRSRLIETIFTSLPVRLSYFLADGYRNHSRRVVAAKADRQLQICPQTAARVFRGHGDLKLGRSHVQTGPVDVIICGHAHRCARRQYQLDGRPRVVYALGSWIEGGSYLEVVGEEFHLHPTLDD